MPIEAETVEGDKKRWRFATTPPLPSYLLAFAVGPFDRVPAGQSQSGVPVAIYVPRGKAGETAYSAAVTFGCDSVASLVTPAAANLPIAAAS